jgi:hypothetical protein
MIGMVVRLFYVIDQLDKFRDCLIGLYLGIVYHISWSFHVPCRLVSVMTFFPELLNPLKSAMDRLHHPLQQDRVSSVSQSSQTMVRSD